LKACLIWKKSDEVNKLKKTIIDEKRGLVHYKICRKETGSSFTDYVIFRIPSDVVLTPFFSSMTVNSFDDIYELGKYYFLRSEKCYSGFAFLDSRRSTDFPVSHTFEETGRFLNSAAALTCTLNRLSENDRIRLNEEGFKYNGRNDELLSLLNDWLEKGYINANPRNNERVIFKFIHPCLGNISEKAQKNSLLINSNFFILETGDMQSPCSMIGQPFGALIGNGEVMLPPLFRRDVLLRYKGGHSEIRDLDISDVRVVIGSDEYRDGVNATFFRRPAFERTPPCNGTDLIIVNDEMMAYKHKGNSLIPDAGFVVQVPSTAVPGCRKVRYFFDDSVDFAVQVGPSLIVDGNPRTEIHGEFNSLISENHTGINFPPNVFETQWNVSKAARTAIGFSKDEMILLLVAGCNAGEYIEGYDSLGFSFREMTEIMLTEGVENAVSLDGGGSSQILHGKAKVLKLADRRGLRGHEFERPTPVGIKITF